MPKFVVDLTSMPYGMFHCEYPVIEAASHDAAAALVPARAQDSEVPATGLHLQDPEGDYDGRHVAHYTVLDAPEPEDVSDGWHDQHEVGGFTVYGPLDPGAE